MRSGALVLLAALPLAAAAAAGVETSGRVALWSSSRTLDDEAALAPAQLWLRASSSHGVGRLRLGTYAEGWAGVETLGDGDTGDGRLREAYVRLGSERLELRAGWQILAWGRADGINPTDVVAPRELTVLTRDVDDQRFGVPAVRATGFAGPWSASAIWIAGFEPSSLPLPDEAPLVAAEPDDEAAQWAARLEYVAGALEGSLSYADVHDVLPSQLLLRAGTPAELRHERQRVAGLDVAKALGRFGLRAEAAWSQPADAAATAVFARQTQWFVVAGGDRTFGEYFNVNLQYYFRRVAQTAALDGADPTGAALGRQFAILAAQYDRIDRGITIRLAHQWLNETLMADLSAVVSTARRGYLVRPSLKYRATDDFTVALGGELPGGEAESSFGALRDNRAGFLELRWGF